jgi:hypothetical protein
MILDFSIDIGQVITWVLLGAAIIISYTKHSEKVNKHDNILYDDNGEVNVITVSSLGRVQTACQTAIMSEHEHLKKDVNGLGGTVRNLDSKMSLHERATLNRVLDLRECLVLLSTQAEKPCDMRHTSD